VGWHPYFYRTGACTVHLPASARWELNAESEPTPTGGLAAVSGKDDFRHSRVMGTDEHWDETFTGLPAGPVSCWTEELVPLLTTTGRTTRVRVRRLVNWVAGEMAGGPEPMRHVQLYTPPSRNAICIEPLSAPPDAINLHARKHPQANVCELAPGEEVTYACEMRIEVTLG
jgi:galactose mutarotase-like enzyme